MFNHERCGWLLKSAQPLCSLNPAWDLTIYNASSSAYTLTVMSWVALGFVPMVLAYHAWNYWVFRRRLGQPSGSQA